MTMEFYSNGKLLLSGEYAILDGACGWAIPTKYGQYLRVEKRNTSHLTWKSLDNEGKLWFEGTYDLKTFEEISSADGNISKMLRKILLAIRNLNPDFLMSSEGLEVETELTFPQDWGLGSSSTLVNNVAQWANIDAYGLLEGTFGGSGYDIACAQHNKPIIYHINKGLQTALELKRGVPFSGSLYFVFLNKKQNSRDGIAIYQKRKIDKVLLVEQISIISKRMSKSQSIEDFERLMTHHEKLISEALGIPPVQQELFSDYFGSVKSLGAWGGDFVLATGNERTPSYFKEKGYETIIPFSEMVLS